MANDIQLKRSSVPNKIPDAANVLIGEPVVNLTDQVLYTKNATGTVIVIGSGTTSNIAEGTNLYFSNARSIAALSAGQNITIDANGRINSTATGGGGSYSDTDTYSNVQLIGYATNANVALKANVIDLTTANVSEVSNLYFTNARVVTALSSQTLNNATFTGNVVVGNSANIGNISSVNNFFKVNSLGSVSGATTINLTLGNMVTATATGAVQWSVTGLQGTSSYGSILVLELTNGGAGTQTWMSGIKWPGGTPPTLQPSGVDVLGFISDDNGTTWRGVLNMSNSS